MTKINLLKNRLDARLDQDVEQTSESGGGKRNFRLILNLIFMSIFSVGLIIYEKGQLDLLTEKKNSLANQESGLASEVAVKEQEVLSLGELEIQSRGMNERVGALKELGQRRLTEIKVLEFLQSTLPERVWFSELTYDAGKLTIQGLAVQDDDLAQFMKQVQSSSIFSEVVLRRSEKIKEQGEDLVRFEVFCSVEISS